MIKATDEFVKVVAVVSRQHPEFKRWFTDWKNAEMEKLPHALNNTGVQQGRAQVLMELTKLIEQAPEIVAQRKI